VSHSALLDQPDITTSTAETNRLLKEIREEVKQLRAAMRLYTAVVERVLSAERAAEPAKGERTVIPLRGGQLELPAEPPPPQPRDKGRGTLS
jgi:hypothetical protein